MSLDSTSGRWRGKLWAFIHFERPMGALTGRASLSLGILIWLSASCSEKAVPPASRTPSPAAEVDSWTDPSPHRPSFVQVNGVKLNVLDWAGTGAPLVYIHGLGDSPHSFDDLAPAFTATNRVVAYARRGHGQSDHPPTGPYDNETLVEDLRQLLDSLGIQRATLSGWSMGGSEITRFAERYPDRVAGIIYFDAGYDWADSAVVRLFNSLPVALTLTPADGASFATYRSWWVRSFWPVGTPSTGAEAEMRDVIRRDSTGAVTQPTDAVIDQLFKSLFGYHRDYTKVKAPVLSLHAEKFLSPSFPDSLRAKVGAWNADFQIFQKRSIDRMKRELRGGVDAYILPNTDHPTFPWTARDTMVALIKPFLARVASAPAR